MVSAIDLVVVLTGGSNNTDPNLSIGGDPSSQPLIGVLNNLYDNVDEDEALVGQVEYRCIYIFNNNSVDSFYNTEIIIRSQVEGGASIEVGIDAKHESQRLALAGSPTGGSFDISYTPPGGTLETRTVNYDPDPATWATNLQTAINSIDSLDCTVSVGGTFVNRIFNINFTDYRSHDFLTIDLTNLTGGATTSSVSKTVAGSPINSVPSLLEIDTTAPNGVDFYTPSLAEPIEIGTLYPEEGFPIWVKRTVAAATDAIENDGFQLRIITRPIPLD